MSRGTAAIPSESSLSSLDVLVPSATHRETEVEWGQVTYMGHSCLSDPPTPQILRDPHCLLWVEVGQDKTKAQFSLVLPPGECHATPRWYVILPCFPTCVQRLMEMPVGFLCQEQIRHLDLISVAVGLLACAGMVLTVCSL